MSMVTRSVRPQEWRMGDKREHLGWIRLVQIDGADRYVCVTNDEMVVCQGVTLKDAAETFLNWKHDVGGRVHD